MTVFEDHIDLIWNTRAKIPHSLGKLENVVKKLCLVQDTLRPSINNPTLVVAAGNHGVMGEGVSASNTVVTKQMLDLFYSGNGVCSLLCKSNNIKKLIVPIENLKPCGNIKKECAMTFSKTEEIFESGRKCLTSLKNDGTNTVILGEMGVGNTTPSACVAKIITNLPLDEIVPRGNIDDNTYKNKLDVVKQVSERNASKDILQIIANCGCYEIAYLTGLVYQANLDRVTVLCDGFLTTVTVLCAQKLLNVDLDNVIFCHSTGDQAHNNLLKYLSAEHLVELNMCLGEGSGALAVFPLIKEAVFLFNNLKSFYEADVDGDKRLAIPVVDNEQLIVSNSFEYKENAYAYTFKEDTDFNSILNFCSRNSIEKSKICIEFNYMNLKLIKRVKRAGYTFCINSNTFTKRELALILNRVRVIRFDNRDSDLIHMLRKHEREDKLIILKSGVNLWEE